MLTQAGEMSAVFAQPAGVEFCQNFTQQEMFFTRSFLQLGVFIARRVAVSGPYVP